MKKSLKTSMLLNLILNKNKCNKNKSGITHIKHCKRQRPGNTRAFTTTPSHCGLRIHLTVDFRKLYRNLSLGLPFSYAELWPSNEFI